jgi:hydroxylamine reductase
MFCYQCEETIGQKGCTVAGVCGKNEKVAGLEDELVYILKLISKNGKNTKEENKFIVDSLFATITNANFDTDYFEEKIKKASEFIDFNREEVKENAGILKEENEDLRSLKELLIYGLKGLAAYYHHSTTLGYTDDGIESFIRKALTATLTENSLEEITKLVLDCGRIGVDGLALLDKANTQTFGVPELTSVNIGVRDKPGILVSGHDLKDLYELLEQTKGLGIDVYTHGEMLPAHAYPILKKYDHLVGNYGGAWHKQGTEFDMFNGPILMTTNCLIPPREAYKDRLFTTGVVSYEGVKHIVDRKEAGVKDFSEIIKKAKSCNPPIKLEVGKIPIGCGHEFVLSLADKIISAVKTGAIKRFIVMAGCDGRHKERDYYTEFAKALPKDTVILTAGCAKYRYNKLNLGEIDGIPRVIDAGQCNDSYSLVVIALKLKEAFGFDDINQLPISYNIAWYEQKAVLVLLALLHLGVKDIHIGPKLPGFISNNVLKILVENFKIGGITTVEEDMKVMLPD